MELIFSIKNNNIKRYVKWHPPQRPSIGKMSQDTQYTLVLHMRYRVMWCLRYGVIVCWCVRVLAGIGYCVSVYCVLFIGGVLRRGGPATSSEIPTVCLPPGETFGEGVEGVIRSFLVLQLGVFGLGKRSDREEANVVAAFPWRRTELVERSRAVHVK